MTYDAQEAAQQTGRPVFLYEFADTSGTTRYTSSPEDVSNGGNTYTALAIGHTNIRSTSNTEKEAQTITFPASNTFAQGLTDRYAIDTVLTIKRLHLSDGDAEAAVVWKGYLAQATRTKAVVTAAFSSYAARAERYGQSIRTQRTCNWSVYSDQCGVSLASFQTAGTVTAISGRVLTVTEAASAPEDNYYRGGIIEYGSEFRFIQSFNKSASQLTLSDTLPALSDAFDISGSETIQMAPGCQKWRVTCDGRFSNIANFLGAADLPKRNRFAGSRVNI